MKSSWFTDRDEPLRYLDLNLRSFVGDGGDNIAILGSRKVGKTELLKKFVNEHDNVDGVVICYVNFQSTISSLEVFATRYVGKILHKCLKRAADLDENLSWQGISELAAAGGERIKAYVDGFMSMVQDEKARLLPLFEAAMNFPQFLAETLDIRIMMVLDEFHEIKNLSTFKELKAIDKVIHGIFLAHQRVRYVVSASQIDMATAFLNSPRSPLFSFFKVRELGPFSREDSYELIQRILKSGNSPKFNPSVLSRVYMLSQGHPFTITAICREMVNIAIYTGDPLDVSTVDKAFILETLSSEGRIFLMCDYILHYALNSVKGGNTLRAIILILADREGLLLRDVAKAMSRPAGQVRGYLLLMKNADLIERRENRYYFVNPLLRFWIARRERYFRYDYGLDESISTEITGEYIRDYLLPCPSGFQALSTILKAAGVLAGETHDGGIFGLKGKFSIPGLQPCPAFIEYDKTGVVMGVPSVVEFDPVFEVSRQGNLDEPEELLFPAGFVACEAREEDTPVSERDIEKLVRKLNYFRMLRKRQDVTGWIVSRGGFTNGAAEMARQAGILASDCQKLARFVFRKAD